MKEYDVYDRLGTHVFTVVMPYLYIPLCNIAYPKATEEIGWNGERNVSIETATILIYMVGGKRAADDFKKWLEGGEDY